MSRGLHAIECLSQKQPGCIDKHFALCAILCDNLLAQQHCGADVGLCRLTQRGIRIKVVARVLGFKLNVVKIAANYKDLIGTKRSAVEPHARHTILCIAPVNKLLAQLVRAQLEVELAVYGILVDLHKAIVRDRGFEL